MYNKPNQSLLTLTIDIYTYLCYNIVLHLELAFYALLT